MVIINHEVVIGENVTAVPGTVIGKSKGRVPSIGNNVSIGANCTIIGDVSIGNNATIGAGSVVIRDITENSTVVGNPAREL